MVTIDHVDVQHVNVRGILAKCGGIQLPQSIVHIQAYADFWVPTPCDRGTENQLFVDHVCEVVPTTVEGHCGFCHQLGLQICVAVDQHADLLCCEILLKR